ncbi:MAG: hypothetical protein KF689_01430 [Gemmatimonadaceae bacterium]|nr:hypothetical protein [Gemmatimonadaceae bacterium]MCW5826591.1 hypothetical protein [Gemmatimonadaceae bacterium]
MACPRGTVRTAAGTEGAARGTNRRRASRGEPSALYSPRPSTHEVVPVAFFLGDVHPKAPLAIRALATA